MSNYKCDGNQLRNFIVTEKRASSKSELSSYTHILFALRYFTSIFARKHIKLPLLMAFFYWPGI